MIKIIDNYLSDQSYNDLKSILLDNSMFPWFYNNCKVSGTEETNLFNFQFTHNFYDEYCIQSNFYNHIIPLVRKLNPLAIVSIKSNLTCRTSEIIKYGYHVDYDTNKTMTAVYYVNTNNGKTLFKDGTEVESVANRMVIFNSDKMHTGTSSTDTNVRCVINLNYIQSDYD